jgi:endonuclease-3 related protein
MPASHPDAAQLREIYRRLQCAYGSDTWHWSPQHVRAPIDVLVGAVLVQHTNWSNAERALEAMREGDVLDTLAILAMPDADLLPLVRVSGTPTIKIRRLRALAATVERNGGLPAFLRLPTPVLRGELLGTYGIGRETADAILLYAAGRRVFEIDAYTKRLFTRIGAGPGAVASYDAWQRYFEDALGRGGDATMFQQYHAYIVLHCKALCRPTPRCDRCPLIDVCSEGGVRVEGVAGLAAS